MAEGYRSRTSPLFKHIQKLHSKEEGAHKREMINGVRRRVCVYGAEKCKVRKYIHRTRAEAILLLRLLLLEILN
jgi:hypothetical protein